MPNGNDGGIAGGSGKDASTANASLLASLASTLQLIVQIGQALDTIDGFTSRSVICEIDNVSGHTLTFHSSSSDHGGFGSDLPAPSIADQKPSLFSAGSSGFLVGVEGRVVYGIEDGRGSQFSIHFDNPEAGANSSDCSVSGPISNTYFAFSITGIGNTKAHIRYVLGRFNPAFSLKTFLRNSKPSGFNPNLPFTSIRSLQPKVTSIKSFMKV